MPMHICLSGVVHKYKLAMAALQYLGNRAASTKVPRSKSYFQGQRSQEQNFMPMHTYTVWVGLLHILNLAKLALNTGFEQIALTTTAFTELNFN